MSEIFDWVHKAGIQPEPITVDIWKRLPEEFCRQVEVVDGQAIRCESPSRLHQTVARRLTNMLERAAQRHSAQHEECLEANMDFDVVLWKLPRAQIRRPDAALFRCAPEEEKPLPAHMVLLVVEVVSGTGRVDTVDKRAEYAAAGIPWYWIVRLDDQGVSSIEILALDHGIGGYRLVSLLEPGSGTLAEGPIRVRLDWNRLRP
ncbi:Uma2 family endonuclease [Nonomuraea sp. K274]|uniref:Uma2 family endonuclease n=1 Tax=Nonomuraea cypriaca TaxID=1187855 RepID=A0A931F2R4_9ACTN|nr:Uma2 family endonuclease [Nonomuraea cypriaca]MBF8189351.1 Uma2 family endonuclease [Nonomuraea cypriaca]